VIIGVAIATFRLVSLLSNCWNAEMALSGLFACVITAFIVHPDWSMRA
jgi:hypothetical protein